MDYQNSYGTNYQPTYSESKNYINDIPNNNFNNNPYGGNGYYSGTQPNNQKTQIPPEYKPLSPWAYMGYNILFAIPVIGFIFLIIFSFSDTNINRRNYARSFFCSMLLGIICIVPIIILAAVIMGSSTDTISQAYLASFMSEFGEYSDNVVVSSIDIKADAAIEGVLINDAISSYLVAEGVDENTKFGEMECIEYKLPVGYVMSEEICELLEVSYSSIEPKVVAYVIDDSKINGYEYEKNLEFYGDSNGTENHFITSDRTVFTLPGFPEEQADGTINYYINSRSYYVVQGKSKLDIGEINVNGDEVIRKSPILAKEFSKFYGLDADRNVITKQPADANKIK